MDIRRIGAIKANESVIGNRTRVKVVKNKMAPPFREHEFDLMYGGGISRMGDILDLATDLGIVDKAGSWYSCQGERIGQGREQSIEFLKNNLGRAHDLESKIRAHFSLPPASAPIAAPAAAEAAEGTPAAAAGTSEEGGEAGNGKRRGRAAAQPRA